MQDKIKIKILITGIGGPAGVNAVRLMQDLREHYYVYGTDINPNSAGQFFVDEFVICERVLDEEKYIKWTAEFVKHNNINVLIPTVAEELVLMEEVRKLIGEEVKIIVSPHETLELCDEKNKLYAWMDVNFPDLIGKWQLLDSGELKFHEDCYFLKPVKGRGSKGCRLISIDEVHAISTKESEEKFVLMENLPGREWTVDVYVNDDGSIAYTVPRLRLGLSGGISSIGRTDRNEEVIKITEKVLTKLKCKGPIFMQWKEDKNGKPKMVEINPRLSGGLTITSLAGANPFNAMDSELRLGSAVKNVKWEEITVTRYFEEKIVK
jgi:carbamoyl-phosphate synthase large subunit